jgi:sigma-B regulation protein RsbU (phosphoserine phosphatase)
MNIERRIFLLMLFTGLACFAAFEAVSFFGLYDAQEHAIESGRDMGTSAAAFAEEITDEQAKKRFALMAEEKARGVNNEIGRLREDANLLAKTMTQILTHRELYLPRELPLGGEVPIRSKEPYLFFIPALRESGGIAEVLPEARIAANAADNLALWTQSYDDGYEMTCFYASERGYIISADVMAEGKEFVEFFDTWYSPSFDPRERPWYQEIKATGKSVFTGVYVGVEGYPCISCVAPYYDENGFAGMAGISNNIATLYRQISINTIGDRGVNFILNEKGEVILSSEKEGLLAASATPKDFQKYGETSLALEAACMTRGLSDVARITMGGRDYYLAYAPIPDVGWSFGTLIERDVVVQPARDAKSYLLSRAEDFSASLQSFFWDNFLRTAVLLLALLAVLFFVSRKISDRFVRPILVLTAGVREIAGGNLDKKLDVRTGDEIETLADSFNQMTDELKSYIENLAKTTAENERIETELSVAARIQAGILPKEFPARSEIDLFASMKPAKEVGGDFYDFYFLDERHLMVTVADVSDKGVPAALFMVVAKTLLKDCALTLGSAERLPMIVAQTNDRLAEANDEDMFVTVFTGVLDVESGEFVYVNAGHNPPLVRRNGTVDFLPTAQSPMLGVMEGLHFPVERLTLSPGDMLFLYTDGVTEAMNGEKELFGASRLQETLSQLSGAGTAEKILTAVRGAVDDHANGAEPSDDVTMLGLVYKGI